MSSHFIRSSIERTELVEDETDGVHDDNQGQWNALGHDHVENHPPIWTRHFSRTKEHILGGLNRIAENFPSSLRVPSLHWLLGGIGTIIVLILLILSVTGFFSSSGSESKIKTGWVLPNNTHQMLIEDPKTLIDRKNIELQDMTRELDELKSSTSLTIAKLTTENLRLKEEVAKNKNSTSGITDDKVCEKFRKYAKNQTLTTELLFAAISQKDEDTIKLLTEIGVDLNGRNHQGDTPLFRAAAVGDNDAALRIIKFLIENGADVMAEDGSGRTFLHQLIWVAGKLTPGHFNELVEYLISKNLIDLFSDPAGIKQLTPMMLAVRNLNLKNATLTLLHNNGVNFTVVDNDGDGLLKYALEGKRCNVLLACLIDLGADPKIINSYKFSLLHFAAYFGNVEGLKFLVNLGLDINSQDGHGTTPLHLVAFHGSENILETVRFLVERGANVKLANKSGKTPLDDARLNRGLSNSVKAELVEFLTDHNSEEN